MTLKDGKNLSRWEGGYFDRDNQNSVSLLYRLLWIFTEWRATTPGGLELNEAGRPEGVESDIDVGRSGRSADETASGVSTVNYQWGRFLRWLDTNGGSGTPSAAKPGGLPSKHQIGTAADLGANDYDRLDALAERVGMKRTISLEIWHYEIYRNPDGDIDFARFTKIVDGVLGRASSAGGDIAHLTPEQLEEIELMTALQTILDALAASSARGSAVVYWNKETGRTYSVSPRCIKHHRNTVEYNLALRESGQNDKELAIGVTSFELVRVFVNNGLGEFTPGDTADVINKAPNGFLFVPGAKV
jgi:hypothetical protein